MTIENAIHEAVKGTCKPEEVEKLEDVIQQILVQGKTPREAIGMKPQMMEFLYDQAYQMYQTGKFKDAQNAFMLLRLLDNQQFKYRMGYAASLHMDKDYPKAFMAYLDCLFLDPTNPLPLFHAADCCMHTQNPKTAIACLNDALAQAMQKPEKYSVLIERISMTIQSLYRELGKKNQAQEEKT